MTVDVPTRAPESASGSAELGAHILNQTQG